MKKLSLILMVVGIVFAMVSCGDVNTGSGTDSDSSKTTQNQSNEYSNKDLGWVMQIPEGLKSFDEAKLTKMEEAVGIKPLLTYYTNDMNSLQAYAVANVQKEAFRDAYKTNVDNTVTKYKNEGQNCVVNEVETSIEHFDFVYSDITINKADGSYSHNERIYAAFVKEQYFMVIVSYNNENDKATFVKMFEDSKFI